MTNTIIPASSATNEDFIKFHKKFELNIDMPAWKINRGFYDEAIKRLFVLEKGSGLDESDLAGYENAFVNGCAQAFHADHSLTAMGLSKVIKNLKFEADYVRNSKNISSAIKTSMTTLNKKFETALHDIFDEIVREKYSEYMVTLPAKKRAERRAVALKDVAKMPASKIKKLSRTLKLWKTTHNILKNPMDESAVYFSFPVMEGDYLTSDIQKENIKFMLQLIAEHYNKVGGGSFLLSAGTGLGKTYFVSRVLATILGMILGGHIYITVPTTTQVAQGHEKYGANTMYAASTGEEKGCSDAITFVIYDMIANIQPVINGMPIVLIIDESHELTTAKYRKKALKALKKKAKEVLDAGGIVISITASSEITAPEASYNLTTGYNGIFEAFRVNCNKPVNGISYPDYGYEDIAECTKDDAVHLLAAIPSKEIKILEVPDGRKMDDAVLTTIDSILRSKEIPFIRIDNKDEAYTLRSAYAKRGFNLAVINADEKDYDFDRSIMARVYRNETYDGIVNHSRLILADKEGREIHGVITTKLLENGTSIDDVKTIIDVQTDELCLRIKEGVLTIERAFTEKNVDEMAVMAGREDVKITDPEKAYHSICDDISHFISNMTLLPSDIRESISADVLGLFKETFDHGLIPEGEGEPFIKKAGSVCETVDDLTKGIRDDIRAEKKQAIVTIDICRDRGSLDILAFEQFSGRIRFPHGTAMFIVPEPGVSESEKAADESFYIKAELTKEMKKAAALKDGHMSFERASFVSLDGCDDISETLPMTGIMSSEHVNETVYRALRKFEKHLMYDRKQFEDYFVERNPATPVIFEVLDTEFMSYDDLKKSLVFDEGGLNATINTLWEDITDNNSDDDTALKGHLATIRTKCQDAGKGAADKDILYVVQSSLAVMALNDCIKKSTVKGIKRSETADRIKQDREKFSSIITQAAVSPVSSDMSRVIAMPEKAVFEIFKGIPGLKEIFLKHVHTQHTRYQADSLKDDITGYLRSIRLFPEEMQLQLSELLGEMMGRDKFSRFMRCLDLITYGYNISWDKICDIYINHNASQLHKLMLVYETFVFHSGRLDTFGSCTKSGMEYEAVFSRSAYFESFGENISESKDFWVGKILTREKAQIIAKHVRESLMKNGESIALKDSELVNTILRMFASVYTLSMKGADSRGDKFFYINDVRSRIPSDPDRIISLIFNDRYSRSSDGGQDLFDTDVCLDTDYFEEERTLDAIMSLERTFASDRTPTISEHQYDSYILYEEKSLRGFVTSRLMAYRPCIGELSDSMPPVPYREGLSADKDDITALCELSGETLKRALAEGISTVDEFINFTSTTYGHFMEPWCRVDFSPSRMANV